MRILVPYTIDPRWTVMALTRARARSIELFYVGGHHTDYWTVLDAAWSAGTTFAVVEHDIEVHEDVIGTFATCDHDWCLFPYGRHGPTPDQLLTQNLGCTKFSARLLAAEPDVLTVAAEFKEAPKGWRRLDDAIRVVLMQRGYAPFVHGPPVTHLDLLT